MGPFQLGETLFKTIAFINVIGVVVLIWIGIQPPNQKALVVSSVAVALMLAGWWLGVRRFFRGPPVLSAAKRPETSPATTSPALPRG
jgi:quinol-cytochrome oxidoreductase complex cytochrome b subunit